jgi:hypothetical protein
MPTSDSTNRVDGMTPGPVTAVLPEGGLLGNLRDRFLGRPTHRLMEEEEHVPFLARILTVAQSLAVVLVLGHTEVPLLFGGPPTVRILVGMALSVLIVTVVAADYCLIKTMQRVPVLARRNQWVLVGAYLAYALFVGLVEISTYAVVLYVLDRDPGALLRPSPLLPTSGLIFIAQVVLRAALIFWTMVQLFLTARKLPVQPNTLTDHSAELLGGKALELIKGLDTEHADLPTIFQAYAASVETGVRGGAGGWLAGWGPLRKRAEANDNARRQHWTDLVTTLRQFSSSTREGPPQARKPATSTGDDKKREPLHTARRLRQQRQESSRSTLRRQFMHQHKISSARSDDIEGDWITASDMLHIIWQPEKGTDGSKPAMGKTGAREIVQSLGRGQRAAGGRSTYIAPFDRVLGFLYGADMLSDEIASWWTSYSGDSSRSATQAHQGGEHGVV